MNPDDPDLPPRNKVLSWQFAYVQIRHSSTKKSRAQFKIKDVLIKCIVKTLIIKYGIYTNIYAEIFFSKNNCELDIVLTETVNILITKKLFKLTML